MDALVSTKITKQTSLRVLKGGDASADIITGLTREADSRTFKCHLHNLDSLIQEDTFDNSVKIKSLRFRQLSHPPPNLFINAFNDLAQSYALVWKVELSCPLDVRWVYFVLLPALPKCTFLRFGTGCFESFHYDYNDRSINEYYAKVLAQKSRNWIYPAVRELHVAFDERKLSDDSYAYQSLVSSVNLILHYSVQHLKTSLSKTSLVLPSSCDLKAFLVGFPRIQGKGEMIVNYEKDITKFVTTSGSSKPASSMSSAASKSHPRLGKRSSRSEGEKNEPPATPFYVDNDREKSDTKVPIQKPNIPVYDISSDSEGAEDDTKLPKSRLLDKSLVVVRSDEDEDGICTSTTPPNKARELRPRPPSSRIRTTIPPKRVTRIISKDENSSSDSGLEPEYGDLREHAPLHYNYGSQSRSAQYIVNGEGSGKSGRSVSPSLLTSLSHPKIFRPTSSTGPRK